MSSRQIFVEKKKKKDTRYKYLAPSKCLFIFLSSFPPGSSDELFVEKKKDGEKRVDREKWTHASTFTLDGVHNACGVEERLIINRRSAHQYDQFAVDDSSRTEVLGAWSACSNSSFDCYRNYWPAAAAKAKSACKAIWPWQSSFSSTPSLAVELITSSAPSFVTSSFQPHFRAIVCSLKNEPN